MHHIYQRTTDNGQRTTDNGLGPIGSPHDAVYYTPSFGWDKGSPAIGRVAAAPSLRCHVSWRLLASHRRFADGSCCWFARLVFAFAGHRARRRPHRHTLRSRLYCLTVSVSTVIRSVGRP